MLTELSPDGKVEIQCVEDSEECVNAWVTFAGERLVQGLASQSTIGGDGSHALGAGHVAQGFEKILWVFLLQSRVEIGDHCFVAIEDLSDVPRHVFFFARGATYSSRVVSASSYRRGRLDLDFDHLEGGRKGGWLVVIGGGFRAAIGDNLAVIGDGLF